MKTELYFSLVFLFLFGQAGMAFASTAYQVSATVPAATGVNVSVASSPMAGALFTQVAGTSLSFDAGSGMTFQSASNTYLPSVYYAINVTNSGGSGLPDTTVTYTEGSNPNNGSSTQLGLGGKTTVTFVAEPGEIATPLGKKRLIDLTGNVGHLPYTTLASLGATYLRLYVGVWSGSNVAPADPGNGQPFSNADAPGQYTGTLTVTTVIN